MLEADPAALLCEMHSGGVCLGRGGELQCLSNPFPGVVNMRACCDREGRQMRAAVNVAAGDW
jgi:hypothetical protein